jgi:type IV pilus assembly protein PilB
MDINSIRTHDVIASSVVLQSMINDEVLTVDQLEVAVKDYSPRDGISVLFTKIVEMGFVFESVINSYIEKLDQKTVDLSGIEINIDVVNKLDKNFANLNKVFAFGLSEKGSVKIAISDPDDIITIDKISTIYNSEVEVYYASERKIIEAIDKYYEYTSNIKQIMKEAESMTMEELSMHTDNNKSVVTRLVDAILYDAMHKGASDIHLQPEEFFVRSRYRIDGVLINSSIFDKKIYEYIVVRIKIISALNIADSMKPQDGAISAKILGKSVDFRVSTIPTIFGEAIVIRILSSNKEAISLKRLGFNEKDIAKIDIATTKPEGIIIVTGPTGSGKTTTLYSVMSGLNSPEYAIATLEDPVEYKLNMAKQTNINHKAGMDFSAGLRAIMRQDPDIILIGEIRDLETASIAVKAAMTGHQVFSTLHTNNAVSAITRLVDIGVTSHIIANSINAIVAQRLVRMLCHYCKKTELMTDKDKKICGIGHIKDEVKHCKEVGCAKCNNTGFRGRKVINEIILFDKHVRHLIESHATEYDIVEHLSKTDFINMQKNAIITVLRGETSLSEVVRCIDMTEFMV